MENIKNDLEFNIEEVQLAITPKLDTDVDDFMLVTGTRKVWCCEID